MSAHEVPMLLRARTDPILENVRVLRSAGHLAFMIEARLDAATAGRHHSTRGNSRTGQKLHRLMRWVLVVPWSPLHSMDSHLQSAKSAARRKSWPQIDGSRPCRDRDGFQIGARGRNRTGTPFSEGFSYHFDFRRQRMRCSWSGARLHHSLAAVGARRLLSTPSRAWAWAWLGVGSDALGIQGVRRL